MWSGDDLQHPAYRHSLLRAVNQITGQLGGATVHLLLFPLKILVKMSVGLGRSQTTTSIA
jgi:hypothetical protein